MTNCEKCGNPLQPGLTTCPICGTTAKSIDAPDVAMTQPGVESLGEAPVANAVPQAQPAAPVIEPGPIAAPAPTPVTAPAPVPAPAQTVAPAPVPAPVPVQPEIPVAQPAPVMETIPVQPAPVVVEPAPVPVAPAPIMEAPAPVPAPAPMPAAPAAPVIDPLPAQGFSGAEAAPVAPAPVPVAENPIPVPAVTNPIPAPAPAVAPAPVTPAVAEEDKKNKKKNKKGNAGLVIIVAIVALGLGLGAGYLLSPSLKAAPVPPPVEEVSTAQPVSLNGFSFSVEEGWQYSQTGDKVLVTKDDESVFVRMAVYEGIFENMNTTSIELSLATKEGYSDVEVEKTTIGERDAIVVSAVNGESSVQYYYFAHTTEKVLSVTVIYAKSADKKTYEETVKKIVEGTTYNDDAINAIEAISPYSSLFSDSKSVYDSSFNDQKTNTEEQTGEQPLETPATNETTEPTPETVS